MWSTGIILGMCVKVRVVKVILRSEYLRSLELRCRGTRCSLLLETTKFMEWEMVLVAKLNYKHRFLTEKKGTETLSIFCKGLAVARSTSACAILPSMVATVLLTMPTNSCNYHIIMYCSACIYIYISNLTHLVSYNTSSWSMRLNMACICWLFAWMAGRVLPKHKFVSLRIWNKNMPNTYGLL